MSTSREREPFPDAESVIEKAEYDDPHAAPQPLSRRGSHLRVDVANGHKDSSDTLKSPSQTREQQFRLDDDLRMLQIERQVSQQVEGDEKAVRRERSRRQDVVDDFDVATNPIHETAQAYRPPEQPSNKFAEFFIKVHRSSFLVRYFFYITPLVLILLVPLLVGALVPSAQGTGADVGGVALLWFMIWLEIVWLSLWAGRILAKCIPWPVGIIASLFTSNEKKWRDMARQLEMACTLFFWWLAIVISFLPTMKNHKVDGTKNAPNWTVVVNKLLISGLVFFSLNLVAKILIQLIAISFHLRTYADRIELNNFQINSLVKLYQFSKIKIAMEDAEFEAPSGGPGSGARTPGAMIEKAQRNTKEVFNKFGDVAGKVAGDFTGKRVTPSTHPRQVTISLLSTNAGSQVLARRLYRTFARPETETVHNEDLTDAFEDKDEAEAAFTMFDKDMNGDITMEELEAVCMEIGRERKSITASLKDLDSVVSKLDHVFLFIVFVIWVIVLLSIISTTTSGVLTSLGSVVLGLSWLFSATAQEFLQSIIFVFVKHPFDVGDRVGIYGNTGSQLKGDDYFVKEISLLYTEFKKMEGHIVQAPNSYLNTLFILNQRRSGGLAEAIPMTFKYGTTLDQIEGLRNKLLAFVKDERREYQPNILTELREIVEVHYITVNIVFFYKTNWQNELVRLQRRNKFHCAMMVAMQELEIQGPRMRYPGQQESFPLFVNHMAPSSAMEGRWGNPDNPAGLGRRDASLPPPPQRDGVSQPEADFVAPAHGEQRRRGESISAMGRRLDFSLGMSSIAEAPGDVFEDRANSQVRVPLSVRSPSPNARNSLQQQGRSSREIGPGLLHRSGTAGSTVSHPNRFFGRRSIETDRVEDRV